MIVWRIALLRIEKKSHGVKKVLIIGYGDDIRRMLTKILELPSGWFEVFSILSPSEFKESDEVLKRADAVLLTEKVKDEDKRRILLQCFEAGCDVFVVPGLYEILLKKSLYSQLEDTPVIEVSEVVLSQGQVISKRCFDLLLAAAALVLSFPVFAIAGLLVKVTSPGTVFYSQERVGYRGRVFRLFKFRSMVQDAEQESGPVLASADDERITRVGRLLRMTRVDELPQLLNVVRGEMSLVGPRPERPYFVKQYLEEIPEYRYRYLVKPGLTGLAQVRSRYSTLAGDKLRYDLNYVVNYSLLLDLHILFETIPTVFSGQAASGCVTGTSAEAVSRETEI
jgi:exopolysaccharide biosynthesis polyprenyl glycosylphosphotransferase